MKNEAALRQIGLALALGWTLAAWQGVARATPLEQGLAAVYRGDQHAALTILEPLARTGDTYAALVLAQMYCDIGGTANYRRAMLWYQRAAADGSVDAIVAIASMYGHGQGVDKDMSTAVKLLTRAAEKGNFNAQFNLGRVLSDDDEGVADYPKAYVMLTLASAAEQNIPIDFRPSDFRKKLAAKMTAEQIAEAERQIAELPSPKPKSPPSGG